MNDQTTEQQPAADPVLKNPAAVALGRKGGLAGRGASKRRTRKQASNAGKLGGWPKGRKRSKTPQDGLGVSGGTPEPVAPAVAPSTARR